MDSYGFAIGGPKPHFLVPLHAEHYGRSFPSGSGCFCLRGVICDVIDLCPRVERAGRARKTGVEEITKLGTRLDLHGDRLSCATESQSGLGVGSDVGPESLQLRRLTLIDLVEEVVVAKCEKLRGKATSTYEAVFGSACLEHDIRRRKSAIAQLGFEAFGELVENHFEHSVVALY